jgi:hypothetical protein
MLWAIAIVIFLFWTIGIVSPIALGGFIHVLLGVSVTLLLVQFIRSVIRHLGKSRVPSRGV